MVILNDWLSKNPQYTVVRAESIDRKVVDSGNLETETTIYFQSAFGKMTYVRGIRYDTTLLPCCFTSFQVQVALPCGKQNCVVHDTQFSLYYPSCFWCQKYVLANISLKTHVFSANVS